MKTQINFKYVGSEKKTSKNGNAYYNIAILQGVDIEKLYYPYEELEDIKEFSECVGELEIKKDKWGTHITLNDFKVVE